MPFLNSKDLEGLETVPLDLLTLIMKEKKEYGKGYRRP